MKKITKNINKDIILSMIIFLVFSIVVLNNNTRAYIFDDYKYIIKDDNTIEITQYNGNDKILNIPSQIYDKKVTSITNSTFLWCPNLTHVTIPNSITNIESLTFNFAISLSEINVSSDNQIYSSKNGILYNKNQTKLIQAAGGIKRCDIPDSVIDIDDNAFNSCFDLKSITLAKNVKKIGEEVFNSCWSLTDINVAKDNQWYTSKNGVLYNKQMTKLIKVPDKTKKLTIPSTVTNIGDYAVYECSLTNITIPNSVTTIGCCAFVGTSLSYLTIPNSVKYIDFLAFEDSTILYVYPNSYAEKYAKREGYKYKVIKKSQNIKGNTSYKKTKGSSFKLGCKANTKLSYKTSNKKIATVSSKGKVTIKGYGNAIITVKAIGNTYYKEAIKK